MAHPKVIRWEKQLKKVLDEIDDYLEDYYGRMYPLHPNRAYRGTTSNKEHDGLFNIGASFTAGYGSNFGRGYIVDVEMITLENVPSEVRKKIEKDVIEKLKIKLPDFFPGRNLSIDFDKNVIKIHGDLSLGEV